MFSAFVGHLIGDYLAQNDYLAKGKKERWIPLLVHCLVWTTCVCVCGGWGAIAFVLLFAMHAAQDGTKIIDRYMDAVGQKGFRQGLGPWSAIVVDNVFHIVQIWLVWLVVERGRPDNPFYGLWRYARLPEFAGETALNIGCVLVLLLVGAVVAWYWGVWTLVSTIVQERLRPKRDEISGVLEIRDEDEGGESEPPKRPGIPMHRVNELRTIARKWLDTGVTPECVENGPMDPDELSLLLRFHQERRDLQEAQKVDQGV